MQIINTLKHSIFFMALGITTLGFADTTVIIEEATEVRTLPSAGNSMQQVQSKFGQPAEKQPSIGNPPITIWRYADFNVYFERQRVLHSVRFVPYVRPMQIIIESP